MTEQEQKKSDAEKVKLAKAKVAAPNLIAEAWEAVRNDDDAAFDEIGGEFRTHLNAEVAAVHLGNAPSTAFGEKYKELYDASQKKPDTNPLPKVTKVEPKPAPAAPTRH
jgi:hypothetical protein